MSGPLISRILDVRELKKGWEAAEQQQQQPSPPPPPEPVRERTRKPSVFALAKPSPLSVVARAAVWVLVALRFAMARRFARLIGRRDESEPQRAYRLRSTVQALGPASAFLVRQFAMRVDLIPQAYAVELARLDAAAPPFPTEVAIARIEAAAGAPLASFVRELDPTPIASNVVSAIFQGVLRDGERVVFRVLRPDANLQINRERLAFDLFLRLLRNAIPRRAVVIDRVRDELAELTIDQLDFVRIARAQDLLRKDIEEARVPRIHVPKVHFDYCDPNVIANEFASGVWLHEVLAAHDEPSTRARLAQMGIRPEACGRRLLRFAWWVLLEKGLVVSSPDVRQFVVARGGVLVLVDPGVMSSLGRGKAGLLEGALERLAVHDVEGASEDLLRAMYPLPRVEAHELQARLEQELWTRLVAMVDRAAPPWERSGTGLWVAFLSVLRRSGVSVPHALSRAIQMISVYGDIAATLRPRLDFFRELRRYQRRARSRGARKARKKVRHPTRSGGSRFVARPQDVADILRRARQWIDTAADQSPLTYLALSNKGSFSLSQVLWAALVVINLTAIFMTAKVAWSWFTGTPFVLPSELRALAGTTLFRGALVLLLIMASRRILFRLDDMDRKK